MQVNVTYDIGKLSSYALNPTKDHLTVINRLLKYLRGIIDFGLNYHRSLPNLTTIARHLC